MKQQLEAPFNLPFKIPLIGTTGFTFGIPRYNPSKKDEAFERLATAQSIPQELFLGSKADIVIYGGAAGGGKTWCALVEALRHITNPGFGAVIFRRTTEDIRKEGALWDNSFDMYSQYPGAKPREHNLDWKFPSGASVTFNGLQHETDVKDYQGAQICYLAFDELTHFTSRQFWYLHSRNRSICGIKPYTRATCNPDPDSWVFELVGPWVDDKHPDYGAQSGEVRHFVREDDKIIWVPEGTVDSKSITFIAATVFDNKILLEKDPGYLANLKAQSAEDRARLLDGSWKPRTVKGALWTPEVLLLAKMPNPSPIIQWVVAVDPSVSDPDLKSDPYKELDECGIICAGLRADGTAHIQTDLSGIWSPDQWAKIAVGAYNKLRASKIVAEKNQGGELVRLTLRTQGSANIELVHAAVGKRARAEPVVALYEQGRITHELGLKELETEMRTWDGRSSRSPNRLDALVWAIHGLGLCDVTGVRHTSRINRRPP